MREERLEHAEPLGRYRPDRSVSPIDGRVDAPLARRRRAVAVVGFAQAGEPVGNPLAESLGSSGIARPFCRSTQPTSGSMRAKSSRRRRRSACRRRRAFGAPTRQCRPAPRCGPCRRRRRSARAAGRGGPRRRTPAGGGNPARGGWRSGCRCGSGHPKRADCSTVEILADDVPDPLVEPQGIRVEGALGHLVALRETSRRT